MSTFPSARPGGAVPESRAVYRLFSWEHSYFSGKARAYLRWKQHHGALGPGFEDVLATPELAMGLLIRCKLLLIGGIGLWYHLSLGDDVKQDEGFTSRT